MALCKKNAGMALFTLQSATPAHHTRWVKIENFDQEYFASDLYANHLLPGFFTHFGRPTAGNYESVFLTVVRPTGAFDLRATKTWVRFF